jgi:hypothetical protein
MLVTWPDCGIASVMKLARLNCDVCLSVKVERSLILKS